jgi:non-ribosomal peptide synthetase component E (peptide arylation enzyme)
VSVTASEQRVATALLEAGAGDSIALVEGALAVTYDELRQRIDERLDRLALAPRSLVVLKAEPTIEFVTTYLALLDGGHVPLLASEHAARLAEAWGADAIVELTGGELHVVRATTTPDRELHPDLALLLSTSGSTGSPKLVRLSHDNLISNARAIATYLELTPADRGITSLPLHYCYGLSVLHSHLLAGASLVMTSASVVDRCFAEAMRKDGVTNLAGVPHTFELLERAGPEVIHVPSLRLITQAGGKMPPARVAEWLARGRRWGVDFFVMYGQTEATARIAYLEPGLGERHPEAIGVAIPGGHLEIRALDGAPDDVGELVYRGPNVMLGYATTQAELALGATLDELRTGDVARFHPGDGVFEVVGRRSRFVKPFGLRIDLDAVEADLRVAGIDAVVAGDDQRLVACAPDARIDDVRRRIADLTGLPAAMIEVDTSGIPRTETGKVAYDEVLRCRPTRSEGESGSSVPGELTSVAAIFGALLGRGNVSPNDTFVSLGGDSLSYVECSVRLERLLGRVPADWQSMTVADLAATTPRRSQARLDTSAVLRTAGILAVVATHMKLWYFPGGSHLMLAVVGYNVSRFHLSIAGTRDRVVAGLRLIGRVAIPVAVWVGVCMVVVGGYGLPTLTLLNNYVGPAAHADGRWHYWFIEALVQLVLIVTLMLAIGPVRRFERRFPYLFPLLLLGIGLVLRSHWATVDGVDNLRFRTHGIAWFFLLGWLVHRATTRRLRVLTTALCLLTIPGFFGMPEREWFIVLGMVLLVWSRDIPLPRAAIRPIAVVAAASMWIYLSHFRIWPPLDRNLPAGVAYLLTVLAGIAIWRASTLVTPLARRVSGPAKAIAADRRATIARPVLEPALLDAQA